MTTHKVVKHDEWLKARKKHLAKEKEFTRLRLWLIGAALFAAGLFPPLPTRPSRLRAWRVRAGGHPCFPRRVLAGEQEPGA